jgi:hypothetical protein
VYVNPVYLPQFSNREDLLLTVSLFDDDTGQPIKLDGCTTALGQPFTGSAWTVTDGAIVTSSVTPLTVPVFPLFSASLLAMALTVGVGLAINPGDPIVIADTPTGLNTFTGYVTSYSATSGILVVQIGMSFLFEIRRRGPQFSGSGYETWYDFGVPGECGPLIVATNGQGISIVDIGLVQVLIPAVMMQRLHGGTYHTGMVFTDGANTRQISIGMLPIFQGSVSKLPIAASPGPVWN